MKSLMWVSSLVAVAGVEKHTDQSLWNAGGTWTGSPCAVVDVLFEMSAGSPDDEPSVSLHMCTAA